MITPNPLQVSDVLHEVKFTTSRSSGPGGQHVNKVNSRVSLRWNVLRSAVLSDEQRNLIINNLSSHITQDGVLVLQAQESRSQLQNKEAVIQKLDSLLRKALARKKPRKKTRPTAGAKAKRMKHKKQISEKKEWRKKLY